MRKFFFFFFVFFINTYCYADAYNSVASVTLKNTEITKPITKKQVEDVFSRNIGSADSFSFSQCTANFEVSFSGLGYESKFEVFQEINPQYDLSEFSEKIKTDVSNLKGKLWVSVRSAYFPHYPIRIDGENISSKMTFRQFTTRFPQSAASEIQETKDKDDGIRKYAVLFGDVNDGNPTSEVQFIESGALPYTSFVEFLFKDGVINKVSIWQGVAC